VAISKLAKKPALIQSRLLRDDLRVGAFIRAELAQHGALDTVCDCCPHALRFHIFRRYLAACTLCACREVYDGGCCRPQKGIPPLPSRASGQGGLPPSGSGKRSSARGVTTLALARPRGRIGET